MYAVVFDGLESVYIYSSRAGVARCLGIDSRTVARRLSVHGSWEGDDMDRGHYWIYSHVEIEGERRGCPKGVNRFVRD